MCYSSLSHVARIYVSYRLEDLADHRLSLQNVAKPRKSLLRWLPLVDRTHYGRFERFGMLVGFGYLYPGTMEYGIAAMLLCISLCNGLTTSIELIPHGKSYRTNLSILRRYIISDSFPKSFLNLAMLQDLMHSIQSSPSHAG